jgi:hypothetical protein
MLRIDESRAAGLVRSTDLADAQAFAIQAAEWGQVNCDLAARISRLVFILC